MHFASAVNLAHDGLTPFHHWHKMCSTLCLALTQQEPTMAHPAPRYDYKAQKWISSPAYEAELDRLLDLQDAGILHRDEIAPLLEKWRLEH